MVGPKVFIVDDDEFLLSMYSQKFSHAGFAVTTANTPDKALSKLREGYEPDVMLLDLIMPSMNGLEFLAEMRKGKLSPATAVIILTNEGQSEEINRAKELGIRSYIIKATSIPSEVLGEVQKVLKTPENEK